MSEEEHVFKYSNAFEREGITPSPKPGTGRDKGTGDGIALKKSDAYVFASYDKRDEKSVLPELKRLHAQGVNIKCIDFDNEWSEDTENKIVNSSLFLVYITSNSVNSLIVRDEISQAHLEDIPFIVIYLEEVELKYGLKLQMASKESINKYEMGEEEYGERYAHSLKRYGFELAGPECIDACFNE